MDAIQAWFVRARHWKVFCVLMAVFAISSLIVFESDPTRNGNEPLSSVVVAELCWAFYLLWFWSLGTFFDCLVEPTLKLNRKLFKFSLVYPLVYVTIFELTYSKMTPFYIVAIFPFHLLAFFCVFFDLQFVSKSMMLAEMRRPVSFSDYAVPFFSLWFFPVGIWFIQPRINRLQADSAMKQLA